MKLESLDKFKYNIPLMIGIYPADINMYGMLQPEILFKLHPLMVNQEFGVGLNQSNHLCMYLTTVQLLMLIM